MKSRDRLGALGLLVLGLAPAGVAQAGGWTQPQGDYYVKIWERSVIGTGLFDVDGEIFDAGRSYADHALNVYGEVGFTDAWTVMVSSTPVGMSTFDGVSTPYVGATALGVRRALIASDNRLAASVMMGYAPAIGETTLGEGEAEGRSFVWIPAVQNPFLEAQLEYGRGFSWGWVTAGGGLRANGRSDMDPAAVGSAQIGRSGKRGLDLTSARGRPNVAKGLAGVRAHRQRLDVGRRLRAGPSNASAPQDRNTENRGSHHRPTWFAAPSLG